ncbi:helix-turn-helix domain-containing protein [Pseudoduganella namucuonensis]|uniref:AraC-type DNA-binding protein n=1 Tax=Pseudoduganella namucuonensis TaxID=1035707 RepID=A0A1I7LUF9_9BURK|nr:helix-turn-helix domain-containing protein [Pseudoduganella namucuonensis]SFV13272.1 AraC-type DNA-binding protein [Pseudoduganella namucuonensis]
MQEFYKKALFALIFLVVADALLASFFMYQSYPTLTLLPAREGGVRWRYVSRTDIEQGGTSTIHIHEPGRERLRFDFHLTAIAPYSFVTAELMLEDGKGRPVQADLSKYSTVTFVAKCAPAVTSMAFALSVFEDKVSKPGEFASYRQPGTYFSCNEHGVPVSLAMTRLITPEWWLLSRKLDLSDQDYRLDKVSKLVFGSGATSPRYVASYLEISELRLHGRDYGYIVWLAVILLASWSAFGIWFFRAYSSALISSLDSRLKKDLSLAAYRQLTLEPYKDKEKASILRFIATNYTDAELNLESVVTGSGANRTKVNEVLKTELGMTFTSYLNRLRLTEAARLLSEKSGAAIAEIAYSVGYGNVSYFNKLFKEEYGCTPKAFRAATQQGKPAGQSAAEPPVPPVDAQA